MKGFYLIESVIAMLMMSFVLSAVIFMSLKLYEDSLDVHYRIFAKIINLSLKQANLAGVTYEAKPYALMVLPAATVNVEKAKVTTCWQAAQSGCETL